jgi:uncharacterized protein (TIGR03663 family)
MSNPSEESDGADDDTPSSGRAHSGPETEPDSETTPSRGGTNEQSTEAESGAGSPVSDDGRDPAVTDAENDTGDWLSLFDRYDWLTVGRVVAGLTLVAVVLRVVGLGVRSAHWDEARVAYWSYFYTDTGSLAYYWEEHGPLVQLAAGRLFDIIGVSDTAARLPVALIGGLLPLSALLYRHRLRKTETVALAALLSGNAILLYYSRFMRSDVLVATFMFVGLGFIVQFIDRGKLRYLLISGVFLALGFGSKENAILYILTWLGASALVVDQFLHSPASDQSGLDFLRAHTDRLRQRLKAIAYRADYAVGFLATFVFTLVLLFAPRGQGLDRRLDPNTDADPVTLASTVQDPTKAPELVDEALGEAYSGYIDWFTQSEETTLDTYVSFVSEYLSVLVEYAPLVVVFTAVGIFVERYGREHARVLVMFFAYCGVASIVGYPLGSHIEGDSAWLSVHIIVPLAVPAAVGVSWTYRRMRGYITETSVTPAVLVVVALVIVGAWAFAVPAQGVYLNPAGEDNSLAQYAQPNSDLGPLTDQMDSIAAEHNGTDVLLFYGEQGEDYDSGESLITPQITENYTGQWQVRPACSQWGTTQPLNWYFAVTDATADCERDADALAEMASSGDVPIIVTTPADSTVPEGALSDYQSTSYYLRNTGQEVVIYTHTSWTNEDI